MIVTFGPTEGLLVQNGTDLYSLDLDGVEFAKACGGNTHPDGESCVTLARIGEDAWAMGDSKRPGAEPLRFTTAELGAAGIDPARFGRSA
ncbi:DUF397 domain-containing protein [Streptomyces sp. NPDC006195]|uniref:DUF397 domain-containing protein n=1 Tax=unclassified Streptomyces TaxID=2593676 RepID=UPI0033A6997D